MINENRAVRLICTVSFLLSLFIFTGCDGFKIGNSFLEKPTGGSVTKEDIFSSAENAKDFLWHAYVSLPFGIPLDKKIRVENFMIEMFWEGICWQA